MSIVPEGCLSQSLQLARETLAASEAFQAFVGCEDAASALDRIYFEGFPQPEGDEYTIGERELYYPGAFVSSAVNQSLSFRADAVGIGEFYVLSGNLFIVLRRVVPVALEYDEAQADLDWENVLGKILGDLFRLGGRGDYLAFTKGNATWYRNSKNAYSAQGQIQSCDIELSWGPE